MSDDCSKDSSCPPDLCERHAEQPDNAWWEAVWNVCPDAPIDAREQPAPQRGEWRWSERLDGSWDLGAPSGHVAAFVRGHAWTVVDREGLHLETGEDAFPKTTAVSVVARYHDVWPAREQPEAPRTTDLVCADLRTRAAAGLKKYGVRHTPDLPLIHIVDAYEEAQDMVVYLKAAVFQVKRLNRAAAAFINEWYGCPEVTNVDADLAEAIEELECALLPEDGR